MFFIDQEHENSFKAIVQQFGKSKDREYLAAYYVLVADDELCSKAAQHINRDGINWSAIWGQDWSSGYRLLLELTESLFKSAGEVRLAYSLRIWDDDLYDLAMQAIYIRRRGLRRGFLEF